MDIFNIDALSYEAEKLPTLNQYLKAKQGTKLPKEFSLLKVWIPGKFPSYNLECDKFRVSIAVNSPLGRALNASIDALVISDIAVRLLIIEPFSKEKALKFVVSKEKGYWVPFADPILGYLWISA